MHYSSTSKEREKALQILDRIFSATLFLALQGLPFRGHCFERQENMMTRLVNSGNYLELLNKLMARYEPVMASHFFGTSKNKYTSPKSQNEVIDSIATVVREKSSRKYLLPSISVSYLILPQIFHTSIS